MTIKSDKWIRRMALEHRMIEPFEPGQVREANGHKIVSYGTSSYGYDIRCSDDFKIFTNINSTIVDPKNFDEKSFVDFKGDVCIIPPNSFALARTVEYFRIPRNVLTVCLGKSTYARCGIIVNVTPFEPEWEGYVTLEFSNTTPLPAKIYANEGVAQVRVLRVRRGVRDLVQGPRREVSGAAGRDPAENLRSGSRAAAQAGGTSPAATTVICTSPSRTTCPTRILQVLRSSMLPSTDTVPPATSALPAPPLSQRPVSLSSWFSCTNSRFGENSIFCTKPFRKLRRVGRLRAAPDSAVASRSRWRHCALCPAIRVAAWRGPLAPGVRRSLVRQRQRRSA